MSLSTFTLTDAGNELLARAQTGEELKITRAQVGEGTWPEGTTFANITELVSPVKYMSIVSKTVSSGQTKISIQFSNSGVNRDFLWTEFALWAADPDYPDDRDHDILYGTAYADDTPVPIASVLTEFLFNVLIKTEAAENVTVVVDSSLVYLSRTDAIALIQEEVQEYLPKTGIPVTIPTTGWEEDEEATGEFAWMLNLTQEGMTAQSGVELTVDRDSMGAAVACGLCPTVTPGTGTLTFRARSAPTQEIQCYMTVYQGNRQAGDAPGYGNINTGYPVNPGEFEQAGAAEDAVEQHNQDPQAHPDIRQAMAAMLTATVQVTYNGGES